MQRSFVKFALAVFSLLALSCEKVSLDEITEEDNAQSATSLSQVTVKVRAASTAAMASSADYADAATSTQTLYVYAFEKGKEQPAAMQSLQISTASGASADLLTLRKGVEYHLVAVMADPTAYNLPENPTLSSLITPVTTGLAAGMAVSPLQMGVADIVPTADATSVHLQLYFQQCAVKIELSGLPDVCTGAYVSVSPVYGSLSLDATGNDSRSARVPCTLTDGVWTTGEVYLFPSDSEQTVFTIAYNDQQGEQFATATYQQALRAGVPYRLAGTYEGGMLQVTGSVTTATWTDPVELAFTFDNNGDSTIGDGTGGGGNDPGGGTDPGTQGGESVATEIPSPYTLWQGHVVAAVLDIEGQPVDDASDLDEATLLLLSLSDWSGQTSALNTENPTTAMTTAASYAEYGLSGWSVPTTEQARLLMAAYGTALENVLAQADADPIVLTDAKGGSLRYLCEDATKSFAWNKTTVTKAGAKLNTYHLRLVKEVHMTLGDE